LYFKNNVDEPPQESILLSTRKSHTKQHITNIVKCCRKTKGN